MSKELFEAVCRCTRCDAPREVWRCDTQPPEPWLNRPDHPVMGLGIDPGNIKEHGPNTAALRQAWAEGCQQGWLDSYQRECEEDPLEGERFFDHLWAMLPPYLRGRVWLANLVRCRRSPERDGKSLLQETLDRCYTHHLRPLLDNYRPRLLLVYHGQTRDYLLRSGFIARQYPGDPRNLPQVLYLGQNETAPKVVPLQDRRAVVYMQHPTFRRYTNEVARVHREVIDGVCRDLGLNEATGGNR